ncbi:MAG: oligopeptidase, partial [Actinoplanes sp.]|nr:oligopeptidase [Actinoplanes sp.]
MVRQVPAERIFHGDTVTDEFSWLTDKESPQTIAYLDAENAWTAKATEHLAGLRQTVFDEIKRRTKETDLSVPSRKGGFWYYTRTEEGRQYGIQCRVAVRPGEVDPPQDMAGEEVLLDGNELAKGRDFFALGTFDVSPDGHRLAYSTDFAGDERFTLKIKDLRTGDVLADEVPDTAYGSAWSADACVLFYITVDEAWRPNKVWRHVVGEPASADVVVFEEPDERYWVGVELTRSEKFIVIDAQSKMTSEVRVIDAANPTAEPALIRERRQGVEYSIEHHGHRFLILHNEDAEDFAVASTSVDNPGEWVELIAHQPGTRIESVDAFVRHIVVSQRRDGLTGLRVLADGSTDSYDMDFPEPLYSVGLAGNPEYETSSVRISYTSMVTPDSIFDIDLI